MNEHEHDAESENWYYCAIEQHWYPGNNTRPVNWCYGCKAPGTRLNPGDPDDCPCETIEEQSYERAAHYKYGEKY